MVEGDGAAVSAVTPAPLRIGLLLKYRDQKEEVPDYWYRLFPGDSEWLKRIVRVPEVTGPDVVSHPS